MSLLDYLLPYDFSPLTILSYMLLLGFYGVGLLQMPDQDRPSALRIFAFVLGVMISCAVMQTRFDYYAQYMFFIHRSQHRLLHHIGPIFALFLFVGLIYFWLWPPIHFDAMLTYIPPAMMSILGILLMLRRAMHQYEN